MTKAQRKIIFNWCWAVALLIIASIFNEWILKHWETLKWPAFAVLIFAGMLSKNKPSRAEVHLKFNQVFDEHPWIKIYIVAFGIAIAIGDYYAISNHIDLLSEVGFFGFAIAILLLFLPVFIIKQMEAWNEAGL